MSEYYSLSEMDALSRHAARGAGYSWGLAEDVGKSVRWLTAYGLAGAETLATLLPRVEKRIAAFKPRQCGGSWSSDASLLCPIYCGTAINDQGKLLAQGHIHKINHVLYPLLVLPQAARLTATHNISIRFRMDDITIDCEKDSLVIVEGAQFDLSEANIHCQKSACQGSETKTTTIFPTPRGRSVSQAVIATLKHFAHKTYAPATATSRLTGAGAGLTDND